MFRFKPKLPVDDHVRQWTDNGFERLAKMLGRDTLVRAQVILPTDQFFPDAFDGSKESVTRMAGRVAGYMGVPLDSFTIEIFADNEEAWQETLIHRSYREGEAKDAAALYFHQPEEGRHLVGVHAKQLKNLDSLVATIAHELAHVLLLGGGLLDRDVEDMEPLTDLATVFLGLGVFTAGAAYQFRQWTDDVLQGWSSNRLGYLDERTWGYALARFAQLRGEVRPAWAKGLPENIQVYFAQSARWLASQS